MTETCRLKLQTIKVIYTFISAFVGVTCINEISINAGYGTHKVNYLFITPGLNSTFLPTCS